MNILTPHITCKAVKKYMYSYLYPTGIYLFIVNNRNTWTVCQVCSKLTIKTPAVNYFRETLYLRMRRSGVFIINFEQDSHIALVFLLLTLSN